jgi:hypothetical protein
MDFMTAIRTPLLSHVTRPDSAFIIEPFAAQCQYFDALNADSSAFSAHAIFISRAFA